MRNLIIINKDNFIFTYLVSDKIDYPEKIWENIKELFKGNEYSYNNLVNILIEKYNYTNINEEDLYGFEYYINIDYNDNNIIFKAYKGYNDWKKKLINYENRYILKTSKRGNCIDDFIERGLNPLIENINTFKQSIESRIVKRTNIENYHQTGCYETDFRQITLIKENAEKIVDNCKKQLERISDFYTKI